MTQTTALLGSDPALPSDGDWAPAIASGFRRLTQGAFTALCWVVLIKAGLATGAAMTVAIRFVQP